MSNWREALSTLNAGTGRRPAEGADAQPDHTSGRANLGGGDPRRRDGRRIQAHRPRAGDAERTDRRK
jgi:hypothetical protein